MKVVTYLDESDIRSIIAKHFEVNMKDVQISCKMETIGYGPSEHEIPVVDAVVEQKYEYVGRE